MPAVTCQKFSGQCALNLANALLNKFPDRFDFCTKVTEAVRGSLGFGAGGVAIPSKALLTHLFELKALGSPRQRSKLPSLRALAATVCNSGSVFRC